MYSVPDFGGLLDVSPTPPPPRLPFKDQRLRGFYGFFIGKRTLSQRRGDKLQTLSTFCYPGGERRRLSATVEHRQTSRRHAPRHSLKLRRAHKHARRHHHLASRLKANGFGVFTGFLLENERFRRDGVINHRLSLPSVIPAASAYDCQRRSNIAKPAAAMRPATR